MKIGPYVGIFYDAARCIIAARDVGHELGKATFSVVSLCDDTPQVAWCELWKGRERILAYERPAGGASH